MRVAGPGAGVLIWPSSCETLDKWLFNNQREIIPFYLSSTNTCASPLTRELSTLQRLGILKMTVISLFQWVTENLRANHACGFSLAHKISRQAFVTSLALSFVFSLPCLTFLTDLSFVASP